MKNSSARKIPVSKRIAKKERESATAWGQGVTAEDKETCQAALAENLAGNLAAKEWVRAVAQVKIPVIGKFCSKMNSLRISCSPRELQSSRK